MIYVANQANELLQLKQFGATSVDEEHPSPDAF
jgi:hypothetical protein